jgi:hypothetical protein
MALGDFYNRNRVAHCVARDLREYQRKTGRDLTLPICAERVGEEVYGLSWDWDEIEEPHGSRVLAALYVSEARAVLNERHAALFAEKPGLEQYTRAHEVGHAALHVDAGQLGQPPSSSGQGQIVFHRDTSEVGDEAGDYWTERQADWYAAALLMPEGLFVEAVREVRPAHWRDVHLLADRFGVTPTAANVRLQVLKLPHLGKGSVWVSDPQTAPGQLTLGLS